MKTTYIRNFLPVLFLAIIFLWIVWFIFVKNGPKDLKKVSNKPKPKLSIEPSAFVSTAEPLSASSSYYESVTSDNLPGLFQTRYKISMNGKKSVFPMIIEKITDGPIELPNRRSLLDKDAKYKFIDIMPGQKIKVVSLQNLTYTVDHRAFNDDFLVTDNDYLIAYSQAKEHFKLSA